jgi:hypothetical protein
VTARPAAEAEQALSRFQDAIAAGVNPMALVEGINKAKAQRDAVRAELANQPKATVLDTAEVYAMIDSLGDVRAVIPRPGRICWPSSTVTCDFR